MPTSPTSHPRASAPHNRQASTSLRWATTSTRSTIPQAHSARTRSTLRYTPRTATTDPSVTRETCILPSSEHAVCDRLLDDFLNLRTASENASAPWASTHLTISPTGLGAVRVGMTLAQAQTAAGATFDGRGDGFAYSQARAAGFAHDFVGLGIGTEKVVCVGAEIFDSVGLRQTVATPEGFLLGGTVQQLLSMYGTNAHFVAAPASGMTTNAGYVVDIAGGRLAFVVDQSRTRIVEIAGGGPDLTPNTCTG